MSGGGESGGELHTGLLNDKAANLLCGIYVPTFLVMKLLNIYSFHCFV